jgi:hypothetical protein
VRLAGGFIILAGIAHRKRVNMSALGIGVDFLQVRAVTAYALDCSGVHAESRLCKRVCDSVPADALAREGRWSPVSG